MSLFLYIFLICQILNFLDVFAQKVKEDQSQLNYDKWEKLEEVKPIKKIIWNHTKMMRVIFKMRS